jgi:hypothetical protein
VLTAALAGYAATVQVSGREFTGWLRAGVGVALIAAPAAPIRLSGREEPTPASELLMRTIGIRDLVLGLGTVAAARSAPEGDGRRWIAAALASDALDTVISLASARAIGKRDAAAAAVLAAVFATADVLALSRQDLLSPGARRRGRLPLSERPG